MKCQNDNLLSPVSSYVPWLFVFMQVYMSENLFFVVSTFRSSSVFDYLDIFAGNTKRRLNFGLHLKSKEMVHWYFLNYFGPRGALWSSNTSAQLPCGGTWVQILSRPTPENILLW